MSSPVTAPTSSLGPPPVPPGQLTVAPSASETRQFLTELDAWVATLRATLDELDAGAQLATDPDAYTSEITLAMSLCQSIASRRDELVKVWDSGRVGPEELARVAVLMWGRLPDPLGGTSAFTLGEAATLAAALAARLIAALAADAVAGSGVAGRITATRAAIARCRSQAEVLGESVAPIERIAELLDAAIESKERERIATAVATAGDEITRLELRLIKETSLRAGTARQAARLRARYGELEPRTESIGALAERCRSRITGAPTLAVPSVTALGPPPTLPSDAATPAEWAAARTALDAYEHRLERCAAALGEAELRYGAPLQERDDLRGLLGAYRARAARSGLAEDAALTTAYEAARGVLWSAPCDLGEATMLVERYQHAVRIAVGAEPVDERAAGRARGETGAGES